MIGFQLLQFVQLLICDWLLETRTSCWEMKQNTKAAADDDNNNYTQCNPLPSQELEQFQCDLNSLYCIVDQIPVRFYHHFKSKFNFEMENKMLN